MLTKAFQNHYDIAGFLGGDDDFVDLIETVKDSAGKRVFGLYFEEHISNRLLDAFDFSFNLSYNLPKWFPKSGSV